MYVCGALPTQPMAGQQRATLASHRATQVPGRAHLSILVCHLKNVRLLAHPNLQSVQTVA